MALITENGITNESLQADEIEALSSIFDQDWVLEDFSKKVYSIIIANSSLNSVYLQVLLPDAYPLEAPPIYTISAPWMSRNAKNFLCSALDEIYCENAGESIIYLWITKIRDFIEGPMKTQRDFNDSSSKLEAKSLLNTVTLDNTDSLKVSNVLVPIQMYVGELPTIQHGEPITDRKSVFQAHIAKIVSVEQVREVIQKLKENKKIAVAKHNIFAYRIALENKKIVQDCDDDGESRGGSVLLHLLQVLDACNVLVIVSRWYGGIHLGSDRFKHISNTARNLLCRSGFVTKK